MESVPGTRAFVGVCKDAGLMRSGRLSASEEDAMAEAGVGEGGVGVEREVE